MELSQIFLTICMVLAVASHFGYHPWSNKNLAIRKPKWVSLLLGFYFGLISIGFCSIFYYIIRAVIDII